MTTTSRTLALLAGMVSLSLLPVPFLWGQDDWDANEETVRKGVAGEEEERAGGVIQATTFYQWIYGQNNPTQFEQKVNSQLALHLESVQRAGTLSDAQKKKLELAARGDMRRFLRTVEELKEKCVGRDQRAMNQIWQQIQPLRTKVSAGLFGDGCLFQKTLKQTLSPEQAAQYEKQERQRRKFRYEARIEYVMTMLETSLGLRDEQRQRFVKLLLEETEPPKRFAQQHHDYYVVFYQAGKLGENKLKAIFDDAQWRVLSPLLTQARQMETYLRTEGFVP
ncbi:MAG: hypothetical protein ABFD16_14025 [Thermoguttaceae bacterium]